MSQVHLYLYGTYACHLCEQAEALLLPLVEQGYTVVELIDISEDESLLERYGVRIPVLGGRDLDGNWQELPWPFAQEDLWQWYTRFNK